MNLSLRAAVMSPAVALLSPPLAAAQGASSDAPFVSVATAWRDAWNRHDMDALSDLVAEDVDFVTTGGRWLKGREAFKQHHACAGSLRRRLLAPQPTPVITLPAAPAK